MIAKMPPLRIGIDLVSVASIEESIREHASSYLQRVFTDAELSDCTASDGTPDARRLAARFAVKEAALKVLRERDEPIPWREIGVRSDPHGRPSLELAGAAQASARRQGFDSLDVSLTHEGPFAAAVVVAHGEEGR
jgi:holo-[acyl-carrier protein] synthase